MVSCLLLWSSAVACGLLQAIFRRTPVYLLRHRVDAYRQHYMALSRTDHTWRIVVLVSVQVDNAMHEMYMHQQDVMSRSNCWGLYQSEFSFQHCSSRSGSEWTESRGLQPTPSLACHWPLTSVTIIIHSAEIWFLFRTATEICRLYYYNIGLKR